MASHRRLALTRRGLLAGASASCALLRRGGWAAASVAGDPWQQASSSSTISPGSAIRPNADGENCASSTSPALAPARQPSARLLELFESFINISEIRILAVIVLILQIFTDSWILEALRYIIRENVASCFNVD
jgi:hypothetical protein